MCFMKIVLLLYALYLTFVTPHSITYYEVEYICIFPLVLMIFVEDIEFHC